MDCARLTGAFEMGDPQCRSSLKPSYLLKMFTRSPYGPITD